jgi:hypothetical protein
MNDLTVKTPEQTITIETVIEKAQKFHEKSMFNHIATIIVDILNSNTLLKDEKIFLVKDVINKYIK